MRSSELILSGTELSTTLGGVKPWSWMKPALDVCMEWQLRNPGVRMQRVLSSK